MILFNAGDFTVNYRYEEVKNDEKWKRAFKLSEKQCNELIGEEEAWNRAMALTFFKRNREQLRSRKEREAFVEEFTTFKKTWLSKEDRDSA